MRRGPYIAIEGVIGVGKTTLARMLHEQLGGTLLLEVVEENPFLKDFYRDRKRYAFQTQIFFLLSRYRQLRETLIEGLRNGKVISDYLFHKDRIFARLNLDGDEWDLYTRVYEALIERLPRPDLVIYLRASTDVLMYRIALRDRPFERGMDRSYIEALRQAYEAFFARYDESPLLILDADRLDFVYREEDREAVLEQVREALGLEVGEDP